MSLPPPPFYSLDPKFSPPWRTWLDSLWRVSSDKSGSTSDRPTRGLYVGLYYFDISLNKPIFYNGANWVDATGAIV